MKKYLTLTAIMLFMAFVFTGCGNAKKETSSEPVNLLVSAGAGFKDAGEKLKENYIQKHADVKISYNFASSGTLQKQIEEGAPTDLFISAAEAQVIALSQKGLIEEGSRKDLLGNELVLIAGKDSKITGFSDLASDNLNKISIGTPETVPAGMYAKETLTNLKLWDKVQPKLVLAKDVRQVLTYVETGNVDAGLVYHSDAIKGKEIKIVAVAPDDSHSPIIFTMAVIKSSKHLKEVNDFAAFLLSDEAKKVYVKYGFKPLNK